MALQVTKNVSVLNSLQSLKQTNRDLDKVQRQLSSGKKLNRSSDDPSSFSLSQKLRAQVKLMDQASQNIQSGKNMISTADSSLQKVSDLLSEIQSSIVFAQNNGSADQSQIEAEQEAVNDAISSINRIAQSVDFNGKNLLDGSQKIQTLSRVGSAINNLTIQEMTFPNGRAERDLQLDLVESAVRGRVQLGSASGEATIRVKGPNGTEEISVSSVGPAKVAEAINGTSGNTGVFASSPGGSTLALTEDFGEDQIVRLEVVEGTVEINGSDRGSGFSTEDLGENPRINFNGMEFEGNGRSFDIISNFADFEFDLNPGNSTVAITPGQYSLNEQRFSTKNSGTNLQIGDEFDQEDRLRIGIPSLRPSELGSSPEQDVIGRALGSSGAVKGGTLNSIKTGGGNSLLEDPDNAQEIVDKVSKQVQSIRSFLGVTSGKFLQNRGDSIEVLQEQTKSTNSQIEDVNMAEKISDRSQLQTKQQAGLAVLAQSNQFRQSVIQNLL